MKSFLAPVLVLLALIGCDDGEKQIRFDKQSAYERVFVVDEGNWRYLRFGTPEGANQSILSLTEPASVPSRYIRIASLGAVLTEKRDRALMLGLGGGTYARLLRRHFPGLAVDAVEIDPVVVEAARKYFGVTEGKRLRIHVADGAKFIRQTRRIYDLVFLDAYSGEGLPRQLSTPAFFDAVREKTADRGVVVLNLFRQKGREPSLIEVFQSRFPHIACIRTTDDLNLVVFGKTSAWPSRPELIDAARRLSETAKLPFDLGVFAEDMIWNCAGLPRTNAP